MFLDQTGFKLHTGWHWVHVDWPVSVMIETDLHVSQDVCPSSLFLYFPAGQSIHLILLVSGSLP